MLVPPERGTIIGRALWKVGLSAELNLLLWDFSSDLLTDSICRPRDRIDVEDAE